MGSGILWNDLLSRFHFLLNMKDGSRELCEFSVQRDAWTIAIWKVHFVIHNLIPNFFSPKKETLKFLHQHKPCAFYFWQIRLFSKIISQIIYLLSRHNNYQHSGPCNSHKRNRLRIDCKFGNNLLTYVIKNNIVQNGPLIDSHVNVQFVMMQSPIKDVSHESSNRKSELNRRKI